MEWDNEKIERMVEYINGELQKGRHMVDIEVNDFSVNERVIHKRLMRKGYHRVDNQYTNAPSVGSPKVAIEQIAAGIVSPNLISPSKAQKSNTISSKKSNTNALSNDEIMAIRELIENKDKILNILDSKDINITKCNIKSKKNETKSFRVDSGLYKAFKKKANKNRDKITDLINAFMEEYIQH